MAARARRKAKGAVVIAAGGTGGHLFPAQALAEELLKRDYAVHLMADRRVREFGAKFPADQIYDIPSATLALRQPWSLPIGSFKLARGYSIARTILLYVRPVAIVGFGGYPSFPPVLAGARLKVPTVIHEQNAVLGRANRALARLATAIATSFPTTLNLPPALKPKVTVTGNPVRNQVREAAGQPYDQPAANQPFRLLVFGGSQGAKFFADIMPDTVAEMPTAVRRRLKITQQCRAEDIERVRKGFERLNVDHEVRAFFPDLPRRIADAQLVVCRSGASTIAELGTLGRPAILVPLPHAIDNDQLRNAQSFARNGAGWLLNQSEIVPADLAAVITRLRYQEGDLNAAASAALLAGVPDAAERLAELVAGVARPMEED
jgi:UDP-N-acetylglucosamine--N-acetylmuramyl-(pentapeptide) pyrophosphoryl-undecaprenol N-acetylglucosamine transferase